MIPAADQFGPWLPGLDRTEQVARLRALRAIVRLLTGSRGAELYQLLKAAETNPEALEPAAHALAHLEPLDRRQVLACFAALHRPDRVAS
ncbi:hypothetical protein [uncultured Methylobacterium sp.]|uniref:hypothetical protein n=1 Tax=uncultured Methylobacterium sp. TaxID=157278 RepID=UPI00259831B1|nr:hypothetical protein [uncultured Methylobacterium sp.]